MSDYDYRLEVCAMLDANANAIAQLVIYTHADEIKLRELYAVRELLRTAYSSLCS